jgi:hypothetical protein
VKVPIVLIIVVVLALAVGACSTGKPCAGPYGEPCGGHCHGNRIWQVGLRRTRLAV